MIEWWIVIAGLALLGGVAWLYYSQRRPPKYPPTASTDGVPPTELRLRITTSAPTLQPPAESDEVTERATTPWSDHPQAPVFRVKLVTSNGVRTMDCAPSPWASHRRTFGGIAWPERTKVTFDFGDVLQALDLRTGEILEPATFWSAVLTHRNDDPPNYVIFARSTPVIGALSVFAQQTRGRFGQRERAEVAKALNELGYNHPPREAWAQLLSFHHTRTTHAPLNDAELRACYHAARRIAAGTGRKPADPEALVVAASMFTPHQQNT